MILLSTIRVKDRQVLQAKPIQTYIHLESFTKTTAIYIEPAESQVFVQTTTDSVARHPMLSIPSRQLSCQRNKGDNKC